MIIRAVPVVLLLCVILLAACGDDAPATMDGDLRYMRSGGFDGDVVELLVRPSGDAKITSRRGGDKEFMLGEEELDALAAEAERLEAADATADKPAPDAFVHAVTYDGKTLRTDDPNLSRSGAAPLIGRLEKILDAHR